MNFCKEDLLVNIFKSIEVIFYTFCPSENIEDFLNLQGKLEPPVLDSSEGNKMSFNSSLTSVQTL